MVHGAGPSLGEVPPSSAGALTFSPLLWSTLCIPQIAIVGIRGTSSLIYGVASRGTELAANGLTWEQWEPAAEPRLGCTSPQPSALKMVHAGFSSIRGALGGNSSKSLSAALSPGLSLQPSAVVLVELFLLVPAKAESAPL